MLGYPHLWNPPHCDIHVWTPLHLLSDYQVLLRSLSQGFNHVLAPLLHEFLAPRQRISGVNTGLGNKQQKYWDNTHIRINSWITTQ